MGNHVTSRIDKRAHPIGRVFALVVGTLLAAVAMFSSLAPEPVSNASPAASSDPTPVPRRSPQQTRPISPAVEPVMARTSAAAPLAEERIEAAVPKPEAQARSAAPALPRMDAPSSLSSLPGTPLPLAPNAVAIGSTGTAPPATPSRASEAAPETIIRGVLDAYETSYDRLDSAATSAVWLGADTRGLARAFATLSSQDLTFDACDISVTGDRAVASCRGTVTFTRRVGGAQPQRRRLSWLFDLEHRDRWMITRVSSR